MERHDRAEDLLIAVDFQNAYLPGGPWACPGIERAMENTARLLRAPQAPEFIFTRFAAPREPVGCWKRYNEEYAAVNADPYLCALCDAVAPFVTADNTIEKETYSSLDSGRVRARLQGKKRVVLAGVVAECCVLATMLDAIDLGYEAVYLRDCVAGCTSENEQAVLLLTKTVFVPMHAQILTAEEYLGSLAPEPLG